ncbi:MAG: hypothetical protein Q9190_007276, partial [Brigantiaea leucoxantha]
MQLVDWLDDLCVRFIINLPQEELESVERICFQVEEAQWYYEDFVRPLDPDLPSLNLRHFCLRIFQHCPILSEFSPYHHSTAFEEFLAYKTRVPVRGAIMLNEAMDAVVLVKGWKKGANWSFPRGKINKDESDLDCAIREVYEETGYDVESAGLVGNPEETKFIDVAIQHQHLRLYVFLGVPMDTHFEARTRKEISKIQWWKLSDLPTLKKKKQQHEGKGEDLAMNANKFYMVAPFLVPLKKWILHRKKFDRAKHHSEHQLGRETLEPEPQTNLASKDIEALPANTDIGRLLANLQQSGQALKASDLPEVSENLKSADDASLQLKSLLRVPMNSSVPSNTQHATQPRYAPDTLAPETKTAAALLALLKGAPPAQHNDVIPQTPMEQTIQMPSEPHSPNHPPPHKHALTVSPPSFPYSPDHITQTAIDQNASHVSNSDRDLSHEDTNASINAWNNFEQSSLREEAQRKRDTMLKGNARLNKEGGEEEATKGARNEPNLPVMKETWRQVEVRNDLSLNQADKRQVIKILKRPVGGNAQQHLPSRSSQNISDLSASIAPPLVQARETPAPYQVTGNSRSMQGRQYPDIYRPSIPPANKLPMPKLTSHSSNLLSLFKSGKESEEGRESVHPQTVAKTTDHTVSESVQKATETLVALAQAQPRESKSPPSYDASLQQNKAPFSAEARASASPAATHQSTLLDLFQKPSATAESMTIRRKSSLEAPTAPVELSALPSPGHSREPSLVELKTAKQHGPTNNSIPSQKRVPTPPKQSNPAVSATVKGPLNIPQFDMIVRKTRESNGVSSNEGHAELPRKSPVAILARVAHNQPGKPPRQNQQEPRRSPSKKPAALPLNPDKMTSTKPPTPKPFQPQILRRPAHQKASLPSPVAPSSSMSIPVPSPPSSIDDRRPLSESHDPHKQRLLSLFTKNLSSSNASSPPAQPFSKPQPQPPLDLSAF